MSTAADVSVRQRTWDAALRVVGSEIAVFADLRVLRDVAVTDGWVEIAIAPAYSGRPAMNMIAREIEPALEREGIRKATARTVWSPDWKEGRRRLKEFGIAPSETANSRRALFGMQQVAFPQCGATSTELLPEFGFSSCQALRRCDSCREPFDYFGCH